MGNADRIVVDASIAIALVIPEPNSPAVIRAFEAWAEQGTELIVPTNFWLEVVNAVQRRQRRGADTLEALHVLDGLDLRTVDVDRPQLVLVIDAMERLGLSSYDAAYLVIAEVEDAQLATADRQLMRAAGRRGLDPTAGRRLAEAADAYVPGGATWPRYREASAFLAKLRAEALG